MQINEPQRNEPFVGIGIGAGMGGLIVAFRLRNFLVGVVNGD